MAGMGVTASIQSTDSREEIFYAVLVKNMNINLYNETYLMGQCYRVEVMRGSGPQFAPGTPGFPHPSKIIALNIINSKNFPDTLK